MARGKYLTGQNKIILRKSTLGKIFLESIKINNYLKRKHQLP